MFYFWGVVLDLDKYVFPWQTYFWGGDCFRLRLLHSGKDVIWICVVIKLLAHEVATVPSNVYQAVL